MRTHAVLTPVLLAATLLAGCGQPRPATFYEDVTFLKRHTQVLTLSDSSGHGRVAVLPQLQGRVMTSTAKGPDGMSFGWINRELVASGRFVEHINVFGGEDRFWLGPEGGQFSIFFKKGVPFDLEHWYTPAPIDTEPFELVSHTRDTAHLRKDMELVNYSDTVFKLRVDRRVRVLERAKVEQLLGVAIPGDVSFVAFESENTVTNTGTKPWEKGSGLLSIWILGMLTPSPATTVVIPYEAGPEERLGPVVNDSYFGKVPADRLVVGDRAIFFRGDGLYRSKIGLSPRRAKSILASYDSVHGVFTVVQYDKPQGVIDYVNSMWELQREPYRGDVVNSYNDGPAEPGVKPMGPFYELETSSPAAALAPGQAITHVHRTMHFEASEAQTDQLARAVLGVRLSQIKGAFSQ